MRHILAFSSIVPACARGTVGFPPAAQADDVAWFVKYAAR